MGTYTPDQLLFSTRRCNRALVLSCCGKFREHPVGSGTRRSQTPRLEAGRRPPPPCFFFFSCERGRASPSRPLALSAMRPNGGRLALFLDTRGLPKPATGDQARYILERLADSSWPFGTTVKVKGDTAEISLKSGN